MHPNPNCPARSAEQASSEHVAPEFIARELFETAVNMRGDADADLFLSRIVAELFELSPIVREAISDLLLVELLDELHRRGEPGRDAARVVSQVQTHWANERG